MTTLNFKTFQARLGTLDEIPEGLNKDEIIVKVKEEESKLVKKDEQILLAYNMQSPNPNKGTVLYRTTSSYPGFDENNTNSFSNPPPDYTRLNRCNVPKH